MDPPSPPPTVCALAACVHGAACTEMHPACFQNDSPPGVSTFRILLPTPPSCQVTDLTSDPVGGRGGVGGGRRSWRRLSDRDG